VYVVPIFIHRKYRAKNKKNLEFYFTGILNWFKLFGLKRKLDIFCPIEVFFELHSSATERKKGKKWVKKGNFLAN